MAVDLAVITNRELHALAQQFRIDVIKTLHDKGTGHWGGSASVAEILTYLYFRQMNIQPENPDWENRDRLVLSKGHASPMLYEVLEKRGYLKDGTLKTFRDLNSSLQGHPCMNKTPGVEMSTGALGHGLSVGLGMSLMAARQSSPFKTYVIVGEGCLNEGQSWEAIMAAGKFAPKDLVLLVDYNKVQLDGHSKDIMPLDPLADKFKAFNWNVADRSFNGHDMDDIESSFKWLSQQDQGPCVIIYDTIKGKGVSFMEDNHAWHGAPVGDDHFSEALPQLEKGLSTWEEK
ncbi:transketolase [Oceanispirochaeta crateris]|uniref:Transketolase n=1 Tax=Oceanispirochaeta crateris TaxID=2518645 RepID=A0A5C1QLC7_9SPIO|nr:transketolase [Oceanispirochaeta crateris]QEN08277.1 transketolase [Oceanispirochaeta crateris]